MKFGPVPLMQAEGAILAHSLAVAGGRIRKGRILSAPDIAALTLAGHTDVSVARLGPGDLGEDQAAETIARAMVPDPAAVGIRLSVAATGRVNAYASGPGVLGLDVSAIEAANRVDPLITIATLPPFAKTAPGTMLATIKIIAYGIEAKIADIAATRLAGAMQVHPVVLQTASLLQTGTAGAGSLKGETVMASRLRALGMDLVACKTVSHEVGALAKAIGNSTGDIILILTASATSDLSDVAPEAVRRAGGNITRFGLPVDPGNLLFLGNFEGRPVIGLPGCARSPALNGADWVLERVVCGLQVSDADMAAMGVGGLLKDSPARGVPRQNG